VSGETPAVTPGQAATVVASPNKPRPDDPLAIAVADMLRRIEINYDREGAGPGSRFEGQLLEDAQARAVIKLVAARQPQPAPGDAITRARLGHALAALREIAEQLDDYPLVTARNALDDDAALRNGGEQPAPGLAAMGAGPGAVTENMPADIPAAPELADPRPVSMLRPVTFDDSADESDLRHLVAAPELAAAMATLARVRAVAEAAAKGEAARPGSPKGTLARQILEEMDPQ